MSTHHLLLRRRTQTQYFSETARRIGIGGRSLADSLTLMAEEEADKRNPLRDGEMVMIALVQDGDLRAVHLFTVSASTSFARINEHGEPINAHGSVEVPARDRP